MYHVGRLSETPADAGMYAGHSEGHTRRLLIGGPAGSLHQEVVVAELAPGGRVRTHLHAFEEAFYVLEGRLTLDVAAATEELGARVTKEHRRGQRAQTDARATPARPEARRSRSERLGADDFVFVDRGVAHGLRNDSAEPARWFEVSAPQPGAALEDTVFVNGEARQPEADPPYRRGHFDPAELPAPSATIGLAGFGAANVGGAALRILVGPDSGASQLNLMVVQYAPGGFITEHDHAFEEGFFFLTGEVEAKLEGETCTIRAGDYFWSGVGSMHALTNRSDRPTRWLETQVPQPPSRYQARFVADWERLLGHGS